MPRKQFRAKPLVLAAVVLAAVVWAVQGGEYGTTDLFRQRARRAALEAAVDSLRRQVDSLERYKRAIETDPAVQERIAREEFGMIRPGELLYRFGTDSGAAAAP
jgi:cell division protein FtsB